MQLQTKTYPKSTPHLQSPNVGELKRASHSSLKRDQSRHELDQVQQESHKQTLALVSRVTSIRRSNNQRCIVRQLFTKQQEPVQAVPHERAASLFQLSIFLSQQRKLDENKPPEPSKPSAS